MFFKKSLAGAVPGGGSPWRGQSLAGAVLGGGSPWRGQSLAGAAPAQLRDESGTNVESVMFLRSPGVKNRPNTNPKQTSKNRAPRNGRGA
jgi:hypothetical protein